MTECQGAIRDANNKLHRCDTPTQNYLCTNCETELRDTLNDLPWWIDSLNEARHGQTRLGDTSQPVGTSGDDTSVRVNLTARRIAERAHHTLARWTTHPAHHQTPWWRRNTMPPDFIGPLQDGWKRQHPDHIPTPADASRWLADNTHHLATHRDAGRFMRDILNLHKLIETAIDRPEQRRTCGPCPTMVRRHGKLQQCNRSLMAKEDDATITCEDCGVEHRVERLIMALWVKIADSDKIVPFPEIVRIYQKAGAKPPSRTTFYRWIDDGRLQIRGYLRADKRRYGPVKHSPTDQPVFRLGDVQKLMAEKASATTKREKVKTR